MSDNPKSSVASNPQEASSKEQTLTTENNNAEDPTPSSGTGDDDRKLSFERVQGGVIRAQSQSKGLLEMNRANRANEKENAQDSK